MGIHTSDRIRSTEGALTGSRRSFLPLLPLLPLTILVAVPAAAQCPTDLLTPPDATFWPYAYSFGRSIAIDGDLLLIGAPNAQGVTFQSGAGYFFRLVAGEWVFEQKVYSPTGGALDELGNSADLSGDVALLGAFHHSPGSGFTTSATVFRLDSSGNWSADGNLPHPPTTPLFPLWVAIDGDLAMTRLKNDLGSYGGIAAFRYNGSDAWDPEILPLPPLVEGMMFGLSGDIDAGVIAISAPHGGYPATETGKVYLFTEQTTGTWSVDVIEGPPGSQMFGADLDLANGRLVVSSYDYEVHVYDHDGVSWQPAGIIAVPTYEVSLEVAVSGDEILVGAQSHDGSEEYSGVVFHYSRVGGIWVEAAIFESTIPSYNGGFGTVVAIDGPNIAVGSDYYAGYAETFSLVPVDCNGNGICDADDIAGGASIDATGDGVPDECSPFRRGDANWNGTVDLADPIVALSYLFLSHSLDCPRAADWNDDDTLNILDPILGLGLLFANPGAMPIPPPFPDCGLDPTMGDIPCAFFIGC